MEIGSSRYKKDDAGNRAVHIQCLDEGHNEIDGAFGTGFFIQMEKECFLCTCWHLVTGYDPENIQIEPAGKVRLRREFLKVTLRKSRPVIPGVPAQMSGSIMAGNHSFYVDLYSRTGSKLTPRWEQDNHGKQNSDLESRGFTVPSVDFVRIPVSALLADQDVFLSTSQFFQHQDLTHQGLVHGDKLMVVGFPYGYGAGLNNSNSPTPIMITRFLASRSAEHSRLYALMDGPAAEGMSGSPVFAEVEGSVFFNGIYTGTILPDHGKSRDGKFAELGRYHNASLLKGLMAWFDEGGTL